MKQFRIHYSGFTILLAFSFILVSLFLGCAQPVIPPSAPVTLSFSISGIVSTYTACTGYPNPNPPIQDPYEGAIVTLYQNNAVVATVLSDANGYYQIDNLSIGNYQIKARIPGLRETGIFDVAVAGTNQTVNLQAQRSWMPGELIVGFPLGTDPAEAENLLLMYGCSVISQLPVYSYISFHANIPADKIPEEMIDILEPLSQVDHAEPNYIGCGC